MIPDSVRRSRSGGCSVSRAEAKSSFQWNLIEYLTNGDTAGFFPTGVGPETAGDYPGPVRLVFGAQSLKAIACSSKNLS